jgi:hypothetical protein
MSSLPRLFLSLGFGAPLTGVTGGMLVSEVSLAEVVFEGDRLLALVDLDDLSGTVVAFAASFLVDGLGFENSSSLEASAALSKAVAGAGDMFTNGPSFFETMSPTALDDLVGVS